MEKKKERMLEALRRTRGDITAACKALNLSRQTFYNWKDDDEEFATEYEDINDEGLDYAESVVFRAMETIEPKPRINTKTGEFYQDEDGNERLFTPDFKTVEVASRNAQFYLERKGKKRGYSLRTEIDDVTDRERLRVADLFPDQEALDKMIEKHEKQKKIAGPQQLN